MNTSILMYCKLIVLSLLWALAFPIISFLIQNNFSTLEIVFSRIALAALALCIWMLINKIRFPWDLRFWLVSGLLGLLGDFLANYFISFGELTVTASLTAILIGTSPIFTTLLIALIPALSDNSHDRLTKQKIIGITLGFLGVATSIFGQIEIGFSMLGILAVLLAALAFSAVNLLARFGKTYNGVALSAASMLSMTLLMIPFMLKSLDSISLASISLPIASSVIVISIFSTAITFVLMIHIASTGGAILLSYSNYLVPLFGTVLSILFLGEILTILMVIGFMLIAIGLYLINKKEQKQN